MSGDVKRYDGPVEVFYPPLVAKADARRVRRRFWPKLWRTIGVVPFSEDIAAAWYCAVDPRTPTRVKVVLMGALAYFVMPADMIPDVLAGLGFTDDATVLATALGIVGAHIKEAHRVSARRRLGKPDQPPDPDTSED
jgi:uncharacterized membrane protein YkvA (DUF1232 family)